jgi:hypothetical protein
LEVDSLQDNIGLDRLRCKGCRCHAGRLSRSQQDQVGLRSPRTDDVSHGVIASASWGAGSIDLIQ